MGEPRYLVDIADVDALDVWGETVQARAIVGANASLALVELAPGALVPGHQHVHEQLGMCVDRQHHVHRRRRDARARAGRHVADPVGPAASRGRRPRWRGRGRHLRAGPDRLVGPPPLRAARRALATGLKPAGVAVT